MNHRKIGSLQPVNLLAALKICHIRHIVVNDHDHVSAGSELAVEDVIANPAQVSLNFLAHIR